MRDMLIHHLTGSSPLARGLLREAGSGGADDGIIPARAGFTHQMMAGSLRRAADHPRSRGVYWPRTLMRMGSPGSSPLARGLRPAQDHPRRRRGIIPARAGFTASRRPRREPRTDHPRSRGVYPPALSSTAGMTGSSPLARGLRQGIADLGGGGGIIPARAGFTRPHGRGVVAGGDHPRSRGVYTVMALQRALNAGSSPLARGLPVHARAGLGDQGIIPARAGFTTTRGAVRRS